MKKRRFSNVLFIFAATLLYATVVSSQSQAELREELHKTFALNAQGRVSLNNINGDVRVKAWDRNEVQLDAVKIASTPERLAEAQIEIDAAPEFIRVHTQYPSENDSWRRGENPARVEYTLTVPRRAQLQQVELINGALDIDSIEGSVRASTINGRLSARGLKGEVRLSVVNGQVSAAFENISAAQPITINSVNGSIDLTLPSNADAQITAETMHGNLTNDFGLSVRRGELFGRSMSGSLGQGTNRIKVSNVNGKIALHRAKDNRPLGAVNDLLPQASAQEEQEDEEPEESVEELEEDIAEQVERNVKQITEQTGQTREKALAEARREIARARREVQRAMNEQRRAMQRNLGQNIHNEVQQNIAGIQQQVQSQIQGALEQSRVALEAIRRDRGAAISYGNMLIERESKTFPVAVGTVPRIAIDTFDGSVLVRAWDKPEVSYTAQKRAPTAEEMKQFTIQAEQRGDEVVISAKPVQPNAQLNASVQFEVYVPRSANLRINSGDGRLNVEGVGGDMQLNTGDGAIYVKEGKGSVRVSTGDGRITIDEFNGTADARTGDGRISLRGSFSQVDARTGDGAISLDLPPGANATVETHGEFVTHDNTFTTEDPDETKRVRRWQAGRGGKNVFTLRTGDGRISLSTSGTLQEN